MLTAAGLIIGYLESFLVLPLHVPGVRIGLANITTLMALYIAGPGYAISVAAVRVSLASLLFGSPVSFIYSMSGAAFAFAGMCFFKRQGFSVYGVSVSGATLHNIAQILVAFVMVGSRYVLYYIPVLILAGVGAGLIVGSVSAILIARIGPLSLTEDRDRITIVSDKGGGE